MCLMGGFLEITRLFHLSGAPHAGQGMTERSRNRLFTKIEKSLGEDFRRCPEGQEGPRLSGVRQKDRRTLSWVESGQVDTAK